MALINSRDLKQAAAQRLQNASFDPKHLVLIHTGVVVALNLMVNGLNFYLSEQIGSTGGLGGLGLRSVLETAQTILGYFATFFTPFWTAGFLFAMVSIARGRSVGPGSLTQGFRRFGSILSYSLWEMLLMMSVATLLMYLCSFVYVLTPFSSDLLVMLEELMMDPAFLTASGAINMELLPMDTLFAQLLPMLVLYVLVLIPVLIWLGYHFRMCTFLLVEGIPRGGFGSFVVSSKLMSGHKWQMLKLDLSFWWYYLLEALLTIVLYLDLILPMMGIPLPVDPNVAYFTTIALYGVLQLGLHWWKKAEVDTTIALAYEAIYREVVPVDPPMPTR